MHVHHLAVRRTARYVTSGTPDARVREVWIACHGYGQLARALLRSLAPIAAPERFLVAPEALSRFYLEPPGERRPGSPARVGAAWMTREDREHEIDDQIAYLDTLHDRIFTLLARDAVRLRLFGFSQGVATVARWLVRGRVQPDEVIFWAGSIPPELDLAAHRDRLASTRLTMVQGAADEYAEWARLEPDVERYRTLGLDARFVAFQGGHVIDAETLVSVANA